MWGRDGELWDPDDDTLLDFSYAGYHEGRNDFPKWGVGVNVRHFGAQGDGETDDTEAFKKAVEAGPNWLYIRWGRAKLLHVKKKDKISFKKDMQWVISRDPRMVDSPYPWNVYFQREAREMLKNIDNYF